MWPNFTVIYSLNSIKYNLFPNIKGVENAREKNLSHILFGPLKITFSLPKVG